MSLAGFKATNHPQQTAKRGAADQVDDRGTDPAFIATLEAQWGPFTLDVAAAKHNAKAPAYYTRLDDGLAMPWGMALWQGRTCLMCGGSGQQSFEQRVIPCRACCGHGREASDALGGEQRVWCNPPYSDCRSWVEKAWTEWRKPPSEPRPVLIAMLLPANRVEQKWWQELVEPYRDRPDSALAVTFLPGRMRFIRPDWTPGPKGDRPPFGCALLTWGTSRFRPAAPSEGGEMGNTLTIGATSSRRTATPKASPRSAWRRTIGSSGWPTPASSSASPCPTPTATSKKDRGDSGPLTPAAPPSTSTTPGPPPRASAPCAPSCSAT